MTDSSPTAHRLLRVLVVACFLALIVALGASVAAAWRAQHQAEVAASAAAETAAAARVVTEAQAEVDRRDVVLALRTCRRGNGIRRALREAEAAGLLPPLNPTDVREDDCRQRVRDVTGVQLPATTSNYPTENP